MGGFSFLIGFAIGWVFLAQFVNNFVPAVVKGVCMFSIGSFCLNFGVVEIVSGLVVALIFSLLFKG